jgi:acetyl esterase/lipase
MKKLARVLGMFSLIGGVLNLARPTSGMLPTIFWIPKVFSGAFSPLSALVGGIGTLMGILSGDAQATTTGALGMALNAEYIHANTRPHDQFERAFGPDWRQRIPPQLRERLHPRRWMGYLSSAEGVKLTQDIQISTHVETGDPLYADLWEPPDRVSQTGLAVLYIHGGGWAYLDKDQGTRNFFSQLAAQGHVVIDLAYTLLPKANLGSMVADVYRGIHWIKSHADELGINPERVVLMGTSAGGHISLLAAYANSDSPLRPSELPPEVDLRVCGVVEYYAAVDMVNIQRRIERNQPDAFYELLGQSAFGRRLIERIKLQMQHTRGLPSHGDIISSEKWMPLLAGGMPDEVPEMYALGTAITHVGRHCPPTLFFQGTHDVMELLPDTRRLHQALLAAGVPAVLVEMPGTEHGFDLVAPSVNPAAQAALYDVERFLAVLAPG